MKSSYLVKFCFTFLKKTLIKKSLPFCLTRKLFRIIVVMRENCEQRQKWLLSHIPLQAILTKVIN